VTKLVFILVLLILGACKQSVFECNQPINWNVKKVGELTREGFAGAIGFIFLSPTSILVNNYPSKGYISAPLQIYRFNNGLWSLDKDASSKLPNTYHARHMISEDLDGDGKNEVIIADHGIDRVPFPGGIPIILKDVNGEWLSDNSTKSLEYDFTFNVAVLDVPQKKKGLFKANVIGKNPFFFVRENGNWIDQSKLMPKELGPEHLCLMTALTADFNQDGKNELFLGGCDQKTSQKNNSHDRLVIQVDGKWKLLPQEVFPERPVDGSWGTVYVKAINWNGDDKPDILFATHDFGFHTWRTGVYVNQSTKGQIKFDKIVLPLHPEKNTEGYINSLEDFEIPGIGLAILAEYRSVLRNKNKKDPLSFARLLIKNEDKLSDETGCIPEELRVGLFQAKKFPDNSGKILFVPYHGQIMTLNPVRQ